MEITSEELGFLLEQAAGGSEAAARELTERYGPYLRMVVRRWLHQRMRRQFDSTDFEQEVWASFFAHGFNKDSFENPKKLIAFLQHMARNKVITAFRRGMQNKKGNMNREMSLEEAPSAKDEHRHLIASQPTPSQVLMSEEEWEKFLQKQKPVYREVLRRYLQGRTTSVIAQELGINERTVARALQRAMTGLLPQS